MHVERVPGSVDSFLPIALLIVGVVMPVCVVMPVMIVMHRLVRLVIVTSMVMVVTGQVFDADGDGDAQQEHGRQLTTVVMMESDLGQQIRQRDADKEACRNRQPPTQHAGVCSEHGGPEIERQSPRRASK